MLSNSNKKRDTINYKALEQNSMNKIQIEERRISMYIVTALSVILFVYLAGLLRYNDYVMPIGDQVIGNNALKGIIAHIQIMLSVFLVIESINKGYIIAIILNSIGIFIVLRGLFISGDINVLPGLSNYLISIVLVIILYRYRKRIYRQINLLLDQRGLLEHMAYYDGLTEIPNRKRIIQHINDMIENPQIKKFFLVFIDINNFKKINDSMGHYTGDMVLQLFVKRLVSEIHDDDILGRLGGDEFALIINRDLRKDSMLTYVTELQKKVSSSYNFENKDIYINASFGISVYPHDGSNSGELLKSADIAITTAKDSSKYIEFFSRDLQAGFIENLQIEDGLKYAIEKNELYLTFQPQYSSYTESLRGFEVLLRWNSSGMGPVSPGNFIPIAEKTGQINEIGEWVLRNAMLKFRELYKRYNINPVLSINISVIQLLESDFLEMVRRVIEETGFDSTHLEFEVTESIFISYPDYVRGILDQIKEMGISIALDDFGTGYASLSYLQNIPIDILKIDKLFIDSIDNQNGKKNIIGPIIDMAHQLDIMVVAEGVEEEEQLHYLKDKDCDFIQGFLLGRPTVEEELPQLISI